MENAIKRAIEGGWNGHPSWMKNWERAVLDPTFWQALGKAEGWKKLHYEDMEGNYDECWQCHWHSFIDHLASGKDADSFFKALLK